MRDGRTALDAVREEIPSLVILDVMMPSVTGLEVPQQLKTDRALCATIICRPQRIVLVLDVQGPSVILAPLVVPETELPVSHDAGINGHRYFGGRETIGVIADAVQPGP